MFEHEIRPRYLEVDQLGVVFNMWYLGYFDEAMAAFFGYLGFPYPQLLADGHDVMLVHTELDWSAGLRYGQTGAVAVTVTSLGTTSFTLSFDLRRAQEGGSRSLCRARTVYVLVATDGSGKQEIPAGLRAALHEQLGTC